jgi:predicted lipoprotein with Yx(FWY)xxD motif
MSRTRLSLALLLAVSAAVIALIVATSGGSTNKPRPAVAANAAISVEQTSVGQALVDAKGRALYLFAGDKPNVSSLSAAGRAFWPPFTSTTKPSATRRALAGDIGTVNGAAGAAQVTYDGHPMYYFVGDRDPGEVAGQGLNEFGARWYVLSAAGAAITSAKSTAPSNARSSGAGAAYGY